MDGNFEIELVKRLETVMDLLKTGQPIVGEVLELVDLIEPRIPEMNPENSENIKQNMAELRRVAKKQFQTGIL